MNTINDKTPGVRATQAQQGELPFQVLNEREMRQFYLNEARMMCPTATEARSEKARLEILQVRVRRLIKMFTDLHNFQWNEGVRQMQIGYGIYMMQEIEKMFPAVKEICLDTPVWNIRTNSFYPKQGYTEYKRDSEFVYYTKTL